MLRFITSAFLAAALLFATSGPGAVAGEKSPVFGSAKVQALDHKQMRSVVGQGNTSAYNGYLGNFYAATAIRLASYGVYLERFSGTYAGIARARYYAAYLYSVEAAKAYAKAYAYAYVSY